MNKIYKKVSLITQLISQLIKAKNLKKSWPEFESRWGEGFIGHPRPLENNPFNNISRLELAAVS